MSHDKIQYRGAAHALQAKGIETFRSAALERIRTRLGSGFDEMGQHDALETVNEGMHGSSTVANTLYLATGTNGASRTAHAVAVASGLSLRISNTITLPDAPDGTIAYDTSDGTVSTYGSAATAFASETSTRKVITSRKDIVAISVWHQDVDDSDVIYVYGDTARTAIVWSTLTDAQRITYLESAENNIYNTNGSLFQVVYAMRSLQGLGDTITYSGIHPIGYGNEFITEQYSTTAVDDFSSTNVWVLADDDKGILVGPNSVLLPIAVVQRRNQGAHDPEVNPYGTAEFGDDLPWTTTTDAHATIADCFTTVGDGSISGAASGRLNDGKFFDAVYGNDIRDRRMYTQSAPAVEVGAHRGYEAIPFSIFRQ